MSDWKPYDYQKRVASLLLSNNSVVLQAPTGAGKTKAALLPFLHAWREETTENFPRKCIYVVPMRVLANQFVLEYKELGESIARRFRRKLDVRIQTGEQSKDPRYEGDLIFCTIDQFLSSYLTMPYGLPNRLANLNAGAFVGSYLVFDEFHLLDPESTLPTTWYAIQQLSKLAPVLLMTATFSKTMLAELAKDINASVVTVTPEEARQIEHRIPTPLQRQRIWQMAKCELSPEAVLKIHQNRSLVLCNTVQKAKSIYRELKTTIDSEKLSIKLLLFHSQFLPEDRRRIEDELHHLFGKGKDCDCSGSVIAIATQTIEVGVDITSEVLHTELAPASALIQRAGRCARYPGEQGRIIVYPVEKFTPYATDKDGKAWKGEMQAAVHWLGLHSGEPFDFEKEQNFVNAVAIPRDRRILEGLFSGQTDRKQTILRVWGGDRQAADSHLLIRDADSCRILIHPQPNVLLESPRSAIGFNLHPTSLYSLLKDWQKRADELGLDWVAKTLYDPPKDKSDENVTEYRWERLDESLISGARFVVVNPALAGYDPNEGFLPDRGNTAFISTVPEGDAEQTWEGFSYNLESYEDHIQRVLAAFEKKMLPELEFPAGMLERSAKWSAGSVIEAAWMVCLLHDVGKLSKGWQAWARAHQQAVGNTVPATFAAAHTDTHRNNPNQEAAAKEAAQRNPKPHHASEGALTVAPILFKALMPELAQAAVTAITRHHTPSACENQSYSMETLATNHIGATLDAIPFEIRRKINLASMKMDQPINPSFAGLLVKPAQNYGWLAYTLLVRGLRMADQIGTFYGNR